MPSITVTIRWEPVNDLDCFDQDNVASALHAHYPNTEFVVVEQTTPQVPDEEPDPFLPEELHRPSWKGEQEVLDALPPYPQWDRRP